MRRAHQVTLDEAIKTKKHGFTGRRVAKKPRPPVACAECKTPIAKFIEPGGEWHPCRECGGVLCEKCCDAKKPRAA